jgi:flagellar M-ring protein FliF
MDQLIKLLSGLSTRQRISIVLAAILTGAGIFGLVRWKQESDFRPLYTSMAPEDAAGVVQKLRETGVDFRLSENGATVLVSASKLAESRLALAAAGLPKTGRIGFELFDKSAFGATDFVEHINYKRALEGELERSVMSLAEVEEARVHLTLPKESVFLDKQEPAKASVVLKLRPAAQISQQNVFAITNLVASAVEGLGPESVSVVDMNGNLLNRPRRTGDNDSSQITSEALEARQQLERDLVAKIHSTLEPLIGPDRFRAGASVECDLTSGEQQEETFDPTHSVMVSSQKTEDVTDRAAATLGIPGTASNLPGGQAPKSAGGSGGLSRRTENVSFQTSRIVRQTHIPQGMIKRMSLSVLVDHTVQWEGTGVAKHRVLVPPTPETIQTIKDLVAAATGFNAGRGDQLIVESLPFESSLNAQPPASAPKPKPAPAGPAWLEFLRQNRDLMLPITLGVALLLFLLRAAIRLLTPRKLEKPEEVELPAQLPPSSRAPSSPQLAVEPVARAAANLAAGTPQDQSLEVAARVRQLAQSDLPLAANVLRLWLQESESRS